MFHDRGRERYSEPERPRMHEVGRERYSGHHERDRERGRDRDRDRDRDYGRSSHRDSDRDRHKRKSRSPPPKISKGRSISPNVISLSKRPRRVNNWDVKPPGFEGMSTDELKTTGLFLMQGKQFDYAAVDSAQKAMISMLIGGSTESSILVPEHGRNTCHLYVGEIAAGNSYDELLAFLNEKLAVENLEEEKMALNVEPLNKNNAVLVNFNNHDNATRAMKLDGVDFHGQKLLIRRPKNYQPPAGGYLDADMLMATTDTPDKLFVGSLPLYITDEHLRELFEPFGPLKSAQVVIESKFGASKGFGFLEFEDPSLMDVVVESLQGLEIAECKLIVEKANIAAFRSTLSSLLPAFAMLSTTTVQEPTTIVQLLNIVTPEELIDDEEYEDVAEDIKQECGRYGEIKSFTLPRPHEDYIVPGVAKVFIEYEEVESATKALDAIGGRKFGERTVLTAYYSMEKFQAHDF